MNGSFPYRLRYQRRKTLAVHVLEDGAVEVRAPMGLTARYIATWVETRSTWVAEARERVARRQRLRSVPLGMMDAASAWFLGQPLQLKMVAGKRMRVERSGDELHVTLPPPVALPQAARALDRWYLEEARLLFDERFDLGVARFQRYFGAVAQPQELKLRRMRRRWGSCSRTGTVTLNRELIKLPLPLTDYVIAHELCHLLEFSHSRRFYDLLTGLMPDWREHEATLRNY